MYVSQLLTVNPPHLFCRFYSYPRIPLTSSLYEKNRFRTTHLTTFLALLNHSRNIVLKCEVICCKTIVGLHGVIVSQVC